MLPSLLSTATSFVEFWKVYVAEAANLKVKLDRDLDGMAADVFAAEWSLRSPTESN